MNKLYKELRTILCYALEWHWWVKDYDYYVTKGKDLYNCQICGVIK